jgi:hypothetical protein
MVSSHICILALRTSVFGGMLKALSLEVWVSKTGSAGMFMRMPIKTHYT